MTNLFRLPTGSLIDGWRVVKELGNGGFAVVYLAEKNGKRCALKVARHREASGDEKQTHARSKRELTVLSMLEHPNIVTLCGHGYAEAGNFYLALEYVDGWTLGEWLERKHPTVHEILRVFVKIASALAYMHSRGILHRDLKLSNVLIRKSDGEPIIIDFSCASYTQAADLTESGLPPGTDRFRAPEQFKFLREHKEEHRGRYAFQVADEIFAVGAMLYELLTDPRPAEVRPRETLNSPAMMPPPARALNARVPEALSDLVDGMMSRDPARRPVDSDALQRELTELLADPETEYQTPAHPPSMQRRTEPVEQNPSRRSKLHALRGRVVAGVRRAGKVLAAGAGVAVVLGSLVTLVTLWMRPDAPTLPSAAPPPAPVTAAPDMSPVSEPVLDEPAHDPKQEEGSPVKTLPPDVAKPTHSPRERVQPPAPISTLRKVVPIVCSLAAGCTGVPVRPEPFTCPEGAQRAMRELGWSRSEKISLVVDDRGDSEGKTWLRPGDTVVGVVPDGVPTSRQEAIAPPGTLFLGGKVYISPVRTEGGDPGSVIVKYERAKVPNRDEVPVCFIAELRAFELKDGAARILNRNAGWTVDYWP
ncbi:serine/threonine protein kinase [Hyalangium versicolor]|uniref:serine/threonine protein kinase n=1 Tax=Hyalangium versicolor TaxID=2861190 RepID=UPI001CCD6794|nr:serine/threonine-protein kinase [Hyalangium versicolor]